MAKKKKTVKAKTVSKELRCFVIMPFAKAEYKDSKGANISLGASQLKFICDKLICKAVKEYSKRNVKFISAHRYEKAKGNFVKGVINNLDKADLVIADLTGLNANVFYELGIRHTLKSGTILLTQDIDSLPADLKSYVAFQYKYPQESAAFDAYYPLFKKKLHKVIGDYLDDHKTGEYDNPVRDFIGSRTIFQNEQRIKEVKGNIRLMNVIMEEYINNLKNLGLNIESWASGKSESLLKLKESIKPFINRVMMLDEKVEVIAFLTGFEVSHAIIQANMQYLRDDVKNKKDSKAALETPYYFKDMNNKRHHVIELYEYYKDSGKKEDCPVYKSFQKFISDWEKELESLTS